MVLTILIWLLALIALIVLLAILLPLRLEIRADVQKSPKFAMTLRPFGRFGPRISATGRGTTGRKKSKRPGKRRKWHTNPRKIGPAIVRLSGDLLRCIHLEEAFIQARFGLNDPAETGQLFGSMTPLVYGTHGLQGVDIAVEPVFDREVFQFRGGLDMTLLPVSLLAPVIRFGWSVFGPAR